MPGVVRPWTECQSNLADDLCPHVQGLSGIFPLCKRQRRPLVGRAIHFVFLPSVALHRRFGSAMISNTDSTLFIYSKTHQNAQHRTNTRVSITRRAKVIGDNPRIAKT